MARDEASITLRRHEIRLTRLRQRWWPAHGVTKRDVVEYYLGIAPFVLPHLADRPFTIKRHYNGPRSPFEWIKDAPPELPAWIPVSPQPAKSRGGAPVRYPLVQDEAALLWMIEFGAIDLHVWPSRADRPDRPDYVLFDLDAHGVPFADVVHAAHLLREALDALALDGHAKTTGGVGLHVQVPVARRHTHAEARAFCRIVSLALARRAPRLFTLERSPSRRKGVFVDAKMNGHGQQLVAVYSVRPGPEPTVAAPVRWDELTPDFDPRRLTMDAVLDRARGAGDLHAGVLRGRQQLRPALRRAGEQAAR
jgi:bifunctional non-homologous end joining protein LigD